MRKFQIRSKNLVTSSIALTMLLAIPHAHAMTPLDPLTQPQFVNPLPLPLTLTPDTVSHPGFEYYELV